MRRIRCIAAVLVGVTAGVGAYTVVYARGLSYLTNDPNACVNCHVMRDNFDSWTRSSHHAVAVCNDCHTPHDFVGKYYVKARNGWHHSKAFTLQDFHEPIAITPFNRGVTQEACRSCHADIVAAIDSHGAGEDGLDCIRCHRSVGHFELD